MPKSVREKRASSVHALEELNKYGLRVSVPEKKEAKPKLSLSSSQSSPNLQLRLLSPAPSAPTKELNRYYQGVKLYRRSFAVSTKLFDTSQLKTAGINGSRHYKIYLRNDGKCYFGKYYDRSHPNGKEDKNTNTEVNGEFLFIAIPKPNENSYELRIGQHCSHYFLSIDDQVLKNSAPSIADIMAVNKKEDKETFLNELASIMKRTTEKYVGLAGNLIFDKGKLINGNDESGVYVALDDRSEVEKIETIKVVFSAVGLPPDKFKIFKKLEEENDLACSSHVSLDIKFKK